MTDQPGRTSDAAAVMRAREAQLERFEETWQAATAAPPAIRDFLPPEESAAPGERDCELFSELVKIDLEYRWRGALEGAARLLLEDYQPLCPHAAREAFPSLDLISEEYRARHLWGDHPAHRVYAARFPQQGSALIETLQRVDDELHSEAAEASRALDDTVDTEAELRETARSWPARLPNIPGYEIRGVLGVGGMAVVYDAWQFKLNRRVALKMIRTGSHASPQELARFHQEAQAAASLQHPHVVQIFDVGQHEGQPYCAMELVTGGSLADALHGTPLEPRAAARLVQCLARAAHAAHLKGIVHRDLKPANVLLAVGTEANAGGSGILSCEPKIADFGLAKRLDAIGSQTQTGELLGTPSYMAPEQADGRAADAGPATDVYALGAMLYELLAGRPPFRAATTLETLQQVRLDEPLSPRRLQPQLPRDLDTICLCCLQKDPHKRYASADQLAEDLGRFLRGEPIRARPVGWLEMAVKWARRHPARAAFLALAILSAASLVGLTLRHNRQLRAQVARADASEAEARRQTTLALQSVDHAHETLQALLERVWNESQSRHDAWQQQLHDDLLRSMLPYYEEVLAGADDSDDRVGLAKALMTLHQGQVQHYLNDLDGAEANYVRARERLLPLVARHQEDPQYRYSLALLYYRWSQTCRLRSAADRDDGGQARQLLQQTLDVLEDEPADTLRQPADTVRHTRLRARTHFDLSQLFANVNEPKLALQHAERAVDLFQQVFDLDPTDDHRSRLTEALSVQTGHLALLGERRQAEAATNRCAELVQPWMDQPPQGYRALSGLTHLAECWRFLSLTSFVEQQFDQALAETAQGIDVLERVLAVDPGFLPGRESRHGLSWCRAALLESMGQTADAVRELGDAVSFGDGALANTARLRRGTFRLRMSDHEGAIAEAQALAARKDLLVTQWFDLAVLFCQCAEAAPSEEPTQTSTELLRSAQDCLEQCRAAGYFDEPAGRERLGIEPALAAIRDDPSFQTWLKQVAAERPSLRAHR